MSNPADDIPASLRALAERFQSGGLLGVICVVLPEGGDDVEVFSFGEIVEHGSIVDRLLEEAQQVILKPEYRRDRS